MAIEFQVALGYVADSIIWSGVCRRNWPTAFDASFAALWVGGCIWGVRALLT